MSFLETTQITQSKNDTFRKDSTLLKTWVNYRSFFSDELFSWNWGLRLPKLPNLKLIQLDLIPHQGLFYQFIACNNRIQPPALIQNIFKFCTFCPNFQIFCPFLPFFWILAQKEVFKIFKIFKLLQQVGLLSHMNFLLNFL